MDITQKFQRIKTLLKDFISPPACSYCHVPLQLRAVYCASCEARLEPVVSLVLPVTKTKSVTVFAACAYKNPAKQLVLAKMWSDVIATSHMARLIWERTPLARIACDVLIPVPLHWTRRVKRGFNQSEEIALALSKISKTPVALLLKRVQRTKFQSALSADKRHENVASAFALTKNAHLYQGKHLVIVDDLFTTGATALAMAKLLYTVKPASISIVVACRVV